MIIEHSTMPVVTSNDYKCIEQKLTLFIRGLWDPKIIPIREKFDETHYNLYPPSGIEGSTTLERALRTAAWSVCQEYAPKNEYGCANTGFCEWTGEKNTQRVVFDDLTEASSIVKKTAKFFGADLVGVSGYDPRWVYSSWYDFSKQKSIRADFPFKVESVIVLAIETDYNACLTSPSLISCAATGIGYSNMVEIGKKLATFIRLLGYNAIPSGNDTALSIPLAVNAGLGEVGRNGMLITPQFGPRVRLFKMFTDMPLQADKPITFGVSQFCIKCKKCAQTCPAGAIPADAKPTMNGPSISNCSGVLKWYTDPDSCFKFWASNGGECNNCIACCPYNKWSSWHHGLARKLTESVGGKDFLGHDYALNEASRAIPIQSFYKWDVEPTKNKTEFKDLREASIIIKKAAKFLGADLVGIANYADKLSTFDSKSVVVMAIEMDYETLQQRHSPKAAAAVGLGYSRMAETAKKVATFIRQLGYKAAPCGDDTAPSIPLAMKAGLGEVGKNGLLITKKYGSRVWLCKVFTELDLMADEPTVFGVQDFCLSCKICDIIACPYNKPTNWDNEITRITADLQITAIAKKNNSALGSDRTMNQNSIRAWWKKG